MFWNLPRVFSIQEQRLNMMQVPKVLLFVCEASEKAILQQTLAPHAELTWVCHPQEMTQQLEKALYDVVFCARTFFNMSWRDVLEQVRQINPDLPVIILAESAEDEEWEEVLATGAFDLLSIPYDEQRLVPMATPAAVSYEAALRHDNAGLQMAKTN